MKPRLHFSPDGPTRIAATRALFNRESTLRVRWAAPVAERFRLRLASIDRWMEKYGARKRA